MGKIFISHSSFDKPFVKRLGGDLIEGGHSVFLDEWVIRAGGCIPTSITSGLNGCDVLILVLSATSVKSRWVDEEWKTAYWKEISGGATRVIPLLIDACDIPLLLQKRKYADFRSDYDQGIAELLDSIETSSIETALFTGESPSTCETNSPLNQWPQWSAEAAQLADYMSDISELGFCAGWLEGLEYALWDAVISGPKDFGQIRIAREQISVLKALSAACGGWIIWSGGIAGDPDELEHSQKWVPMADWERHFFDPHRYSLLGKCFAAPETSIGKKPLYAFVDRFTMRSLKRDALLFDKIAIPSFGFPPPFGNQRGRKTRKLVDLVESGLVIPSAPTRTSRAKGEVEEALAHRIRNCSLDSLEREALYARLTALQFGRIHGAEAYPVYKARRYFSGIDRIRERVVRVVFSKIPTPCEDISWEHIIDYRKDPDSLRRFAALRVWMNQVTKRRMSESEARDLLESLLSDFEAHLRLHKLRFLYRSLGVIIACDEERIKELASSKPLEGCEYAKMHDFPGLDLLEAELTAPGKEVAYLSFTESGFPERLKG